MNCEWYFAHLRDAIHGAPGLQTSFAHVFIHANLSRSGSESANVAWFVCCWLVCVSVKEVSTTAWLEQMLDGLNLFQDDDIHAAQGQSMFMTHMICWDFH